MAAPTPAATDLETLDAVGRGQDPLAGVGEAGCAAGDGGPGRRGHQSLAYGRLPGGADGPQQRLLPPPGVSESGRALPTTA